MNSLSLPFESACWSSTDEMDPLLSLSTLEVTDEYPILYNSLINSPYVLLKDGPKVLLLRIWLLLLLTVVVSHGKAGCNARE